MRHVSRSIRAPRVADRWRLEHSARAPPFVTPLAADACTAREAARRFLLSFWRSCWSLAPIADLFQANRFDVGEALGAIEQSVVEQGAPTHSLESGDQLDDAAVGLIDARNELEVKSGEEQGLAESIGGDAAAAGPAVPCPWCGFQPAA